MNIFLLFNFRYFTRISHVVHEYFTNGKTFRHIRNSWRISRSKKVRKERLNRTYTWWRHTMLFWKGRKNAWNIATFSVVTTYRLVFWKQKRCDSTLHTWITSLLSFILFPKFFKKRSWLFSSYLNKKNDFLLLQQKTVLLLYKDWIFLSTCSIFKMAGMTTFRFACSNCSKSFTHCCWLSIVFISAINTHNITKHIKRDYELSQNINRKRMKSRF